MLKIWDTVESDVKDFKRDSKKRAMTAIGRPRWDSWIERSQVCSIY